MFEEQRLVKRSANPSRHHHVRLKKAPQVRYRKGATGVMSYQEGEIWNQNGTTVEIFVIKEARHLKYLT